MYFYSVLNEVCILYFTSVQPEFLSRSRYLFDPNPNSDPNPIRSHPLCSLFGWRLLPFRMSLLLVISQLLLLPLMLSMAAVIKGSGKGFRKEAGYPEAADKTAGPLSVAGDRLLAGDNDL